MSDIVPYKDTKLERMAYTEIMRPSDLKLSIPRFYLHGPVHVGEFNQAGFVIVDRTPQPKPRWIGSDFIGGGMSERELEGTITDEERPYYKADLAALRFFALGRDLMGVFAKDKYLGMPMLRKICEEGVVPREFDEEPIFPQGRDMNLNYSGSNTPTMLTPELDMLANIVVRQLEERSGHGYAVYPYVTYFQTQMYPHVMHTLETSVQEVVARFDEFARRFNVKQAHPEVKTNPLLTGA